MRQTFLPFSPPSICEEAIAEVVNTLRSDWITTGPKTKIFEAQFAKFVNAPDETSAMLNSCTAGLHLALAVLKIKPGDEVIVPTLTFAATANVVEHMGAKPVFVDVLPDTLCMDPAAARAAVTDRTRAIIPVHYAGHPVDLDAIFALADEFGLHIIEDAAHALPTWYKGRIVGSRNNFAAFSFYATKNLTTAEGGALTGPPDLLDEARVLGLHGMSKDAWKRFDGTSSWRYDVVSPGFKYNMTDIQAAIGLQQLLQLSHFHRRRQEIAAMYQQGFSRLPMLELPVEREEVISSWHLYVIRIRKETVRITRDEMIPQMIKRNIGTSVHFIPLHMMTYYAQKYGYRPEDFPVAYDAGERILSLPLYPHLKDQDVQDVIEAVTGILCEYAA
jgi:dTDP-4-amino-4,6-dideoxygalactose transaminase